MASGINCGNESSVACDGTVGGGVTVTWSCIRDSWYFRQEVWWRGEPSMRPDSGRIVLSHTTGMAALEESYRGHALFTTADGDRRVMATALLAPWRWTVPSGSRR